MAISKKKKALLAASIMGMMAVATSAFAEDAAAPVAGGSAPVPCYGINGCKGTGDCGGAGYSCAGKNGCKGQGFINLSADTCTRIQNGRLTAAAPQA